MKVTFLVDHSTQYATVYEVADSGLETTTMVATLCRKRVTDPDHTKPVWTLHTLDGQLVLSIFRSGTDYCNLRSKVAMWFASRSYEQLPKHG